MDLERNPIICTLRAICNGPREQPQMQWRPWRAILRSNPGEALGEQSRTAILEVNPSWETLKAILKDNIGKELWRAILKDNLLGGGGNPGRRS